MQVVCFHHENFKSVFMQTYHSQYGIRDSLRVIADGCLFGAEYTGPHHKAGEKPQNEKENHYEEICKDVSFFRSHRCYGIWYVRLHTDNTYTGTYSCSY